MRWGGEGGGEGGHEGLRGRRRECKRTTSRGLVRTGMRAAGCSSMQRYGGEKKGVSGPGSQGGMGMRRSAFLWTRFRCDAHGSVRHSALLWRRCRGARAREG